jgi:signal transduction histidine kinase/CheY-like chemotaxis protein
MTAPVISDRPDQRVLILAPSGRDAALLRDALIRAGALVHICTGSAELGLEFRNGAGAIVLTEEALDRASMDEVRCAINTQATWSDVPVIVLMSNRTPNEERVVVEGLQILGNVTVLVRPVGSTVLLNAVLSALRARDRQYDVRDYLTKLEDSNRAKDEFVAMLAHELRNPLGAMRFAVEVLASNSTNSENVHRSRDVVDRQIRRLTRMLDELLDASRVAQRKIHLNVAPVDLVRCAEDSIAAVRPLFVERGVELGCDLPEAQVPVNADADRIVQVIDNLLTNAAKYTPQGGNVRVSIRQHEGDVILTVADNGIGIAPDDLGRIFELFVQVSPLIDRSQGGLGLGLTIARGIVELHGGTLTAQSEGAGRGTRFILQLPVGSAVHGGAPRTILRPPPRRRRVLVAEDNEDARQTLRLLLELQGHEVHDAANGTTAVEAALAEKPEIGIIDIGLPGLNGYEVARKLRTQFGDQLRLIALTGYSQMTTRSHAVAAGFDAFLVKPVNPEELARALEAPERPE